MDYTYMRDPYGGGEAIGGAPKGGGLRNFPRTDRVVK